MRINNWKAEIFTIPNLLSMFRLLIIPVYITIYLKANTPAHYYIAAGILIISCLTDMLDGFIARRFNMISNLGKILDPVADKATQLMLILSIAQKRPILWLSAILFLAKEAFQLIAGILTFHKGKMLKGALLSGKICTTVLFFNLLLMVMFPQLSTTAIGIMTAINSLFMLNALLEYIKAYHNGGQYFQRLNDCS